MAKALKDWTFATVAAQERFARYCARVVGMDAGLVDLPAEMMICLGDCLVGDVYDLETKRHEVRKTFSVKRINTYRLDDGKVVYRAEDNHGEEYFFDIWQSSDGTMKVLIKTWLKSVSPDGVLAYMQAE